MKALVTGATGFIGHRLTEILLNRGFQVKIFCRSLTVANQQYGDRVEIFPGDLQNGLAVQQAVDDCEVIFHLAGLAKNWSRRKHDYYQINVLGTKNLLEAMKNSQVKKAVITSTCLTIPPSKGVPMSEGSLAISSPVNEYQKSKIALENLVADYLETGLEAVIVNPTRVFGPGILSEANSVTKMILWYLQGKWRLILGDGKAIGNYTFVDDVALGHLQALELGKPGERYLLGGENLSFNQFFNILYRVSGVHRRLIHIPESLALLVASSNTLFSKLSGLPPLISPEWVRTFLLDWTISCEKAQREIQYQITPFQEALQKTLNWLNLKVYQYKRENYEDDRQFNQSRTPLSF
jgi:nucleoside-diphosphate-sugar epimerase